jgi:hypothetical protein
MPDKSRLRIAWWLIRQAIGFVRDGDQYAPLFRARYLY